MKLISIFLLFSMFLYSSDALSLPKCIKYESMQKVIENDWSYADKYIKKFIENNSTNYMNTFMTLVDKALVLRTDDEYIQEKLERHQEYIDWNLTKGTGIPLENMPDYEKSLHKEIKYHIYNFDRYKYTIFPELYRGVYLYIRYLEDTQQFDRIIDIYNKIARRLLDAHILQNKVLINVMIQNIKVEEYIKALTVSLKNGQYSKNQKQILYDTLSQFIVDKDLFSKMLSSEKQELFKYLDMFYLDENASSETMMKYETFYTGMLKIIVGKKNLKKHLNNKQTMIEVVKNYRFDIEQIHHELLSFKTMKEYKAYVDKKESLTEIFDYLDLPRLFILYMADDLEYKSLSNAFKYNFSSTEFIKFVRKFYIFYGKPWVWGKYKFEYEERLEKNKKFLELLKVD